MDFKPNNLVIVGAGFSFNAGLPLASEFTSKLLDVTKLNLDGPSAGQVRFLTEFVSKVFGEDEKTRADRWPDLEDIFTVVDLSANTGHHLGTAFSASDLRVVRRSLLVRMIRMLSQEYSKRQRAPDAAWKRLETVFEEFDLESTGVLSMNWDTVFERGISRAQTIRNVDYGCGATACEFNAGKLRRRRFPTAAKLRLLKPHGSVNWLYCDACREVFWVPPGDNERIAETLFRERDWDAIDGFTKLRKRPKVLTPSCPHCTSTALGTRFATFSYRKALDFPMHAASWKTAEAYLKRAVEWVFFGYSMPSADFEFKYLLKRVQLSEPIRPNITVITGGADSAQTIDRYERFFGRVSGERTYFDKGLTPEAIRHLRAIGVMKSP